MRGYRLDIDDTDADAVVRMQDELLREAVSYAFKRSAFYRERLRALRIRPEDVGTVEDIKRLPVTAKEDIQKDNWSFLCVDKKEMAEVVATTGTTGSPVFFALTRGDLERLAENEMRAFLRMGIRPGDVVQVAVTLDNLFIAGLAYYSGLRRLGAAAVRSGPQNPRRQLDLLKSLGASAIVAVPSFMLHMAREAKKGGVALDGLGLEKALLIGETIRGGDLSLNGMGRMVEDAWDIEAFSTYGITEASAAFAECAFHRGLHAHPDLVYAEVLDEKGRSLPEGEAGELVVTTFKVEGMPLLRYRTGDMTFMIGGECPCGARTQRIGPILGRKAHRLKIKGTTVYPGVIENALVSLKGVVNYQIRAFTGEDGADMVAVKVGAEDGGAYFAEEVRSYIRSAARVTPEVEVMRPEDVEMLLFEGGRRKKMTFVDMRSGCD